MCNYSITCDQYTADLPLVLAIKKIIEKEFISLFIAVIVHGSVATNEIIPYSDFDGLLIVKDDYKGSKLLKNFIKKSMKEIYRFDPLQHHGWFIIYESQLKNYPQTYFPVELFNYSKVIFPDKAIDLHFTLSHKIDYLQPFYHVTKSLSNKLNKKWKPKNMFQLKGFLSEVMLLPAIYYQAKYNKAISKKESFNVTKIDFTNYEWSAIEIATEIRSNWTYDINIFQKYFAINQTNKIIRTINKRLIAPQIPSHIQKYLSSCLYDCLSTLLIKMKINIDEIQNNK